MAERLGLGVIPGVGWSAREVQMIARQAEAAGFDAIFAAEVNNDVMATAQLMGRDDPDHVGTWIANIYLRHATSVRRGLRDWGCYRRPLPPRSRRGHQPSPRARHRHARAAGRVAALCDRRAELVSGGRASHPYPAAASAYPVPVYVAALASPAVELGGELADGIMPFLGSAARVTKSKVWAARGRAEAPDLAPLDLTLGLPTFIGDDLDAMRKAARQNLALFTTFPFFQRLFRSMGYTDEAALMERGVGRIAERPSPGCGLPAWACYTLPGTARGIPHRWC